jgi:hypothetical protein
MRAPAMTALSIGMLAVGTLSLSAQTVHAKKKATPDSSAATTSTGVNQTGGGSNSLAKSWVDTGSALPSLNADANAVALQHVQVEHEGFAIDTPTSASNAPRINPAIPLDTRAVPSLVPLNDTAHKSSRHN